MAVSTGFARFLPDLSQVFGRFPAAALAAVALWLALVTAIANGTEGRWLEHVLGLIAVFLAAGIGHLFAEGRGWGRALNATAALASGAAVAVIYHFFSIFQTAELFLFSGLGLLLLIAPYLRRRVDQAAVWLFGQRIGLAILLAAIAALVFGGGLSSIVATLDYLLDVKMPSDTYSYIWSTALGLVGPLYGLSLVPQDLDDEIDIDDHRNTLLERGVSVMVNYVIVPLVAVYALIIHAYAVKIAAAWSLPKGEIGTIVSLFAAASVAAWLIAWPWRQKGTWLLRQYTRFWFWLIPVPTVMLAAAVYRRIADYGVTPERYGLALIALWILVLFIYLLARRAAADMRVVIGVMAALLLAGSFGPWGAYGITVHSQMPRLQGLLASTGLVKDGVLVKPRPGVPAEQSYQISTIVSALAEVRGLTPILPLVAEKEAARGRFDSWVEANAVNAALGLNTAQFTPGMISYNAVRPVDFTAAAGLRVIGPVTAFASEHTAADALVQARLKGGMLVLTGGGVQAQVPVERIIDAVRTSESAGTRPAVMVDIGNGAQIALMDAYGDTDAAEKLSSLTFWVLVKP